MTTVNRRNPPSKKITRAKSASVGRRKSRSTRTSAEPSPGQMLFKMFGGRVEALPPGTLAGPGTLTIRKAAEYSFMPIQKLKRMHAARWPKKGQVAVRFRKGVLGTTVMPAIDGLWTIEQAAAYVDRPIDELWRLWRKELGEKFPDAPWPEGYATEDEIGDRLATLATEVNELSARLRLVIGDLYAFQRAESARRKACRRDA